MNKKILPFLLLLPTFVFLLLFTYLPFLRSIIDALYDTRMSTLNPVYVGLDNFKRLFADPVFFISLKNNALYILLTVIPSILLALLMAIVLSKNTLFNRICRTTFFLPTIIPLVSAATLWIFVFTPNYGLLDYYLSSLFGSMGNNYLGMSDTALFAVSIVGIWKFAGYYMLFFLAGLQSISSSAKEAAIMEGASSWQVFYHITLPLLRPTISFVTTIAIIYSITQIDHVAVMTRGGPNHSSSVLLYYIQNLANDTYDLGKASAATFLTLLLLFIFSLCNLRILERGAHYERS